jgi:hypothetical protein
MENVKDWLDKKGYYNSGLRADRNHRIDLYLSDVLEEYRTELLRIRDVVGQSGQLKAFLTWLEKEGGSPFIDKDALIDDWLKSL